MEQIMKDIEPLQLSNSGSVALGVMFFVMSLICQYGAVIQRVEKRLVFYDISEEKRKRDEVMRVGVIQASSQTDKNEILYEIVLRNAKQHEVVNFGCFPNENETYSYVDISIEIGLLIASGAIDFVVTGCSSGQGMMLACNSIPGVLCGYTPTPQDAFLFGRINNGNAISVPLGLNYGWAGEVNLGYIMEALFSTPFGTGYPMEEAERKRKDAALLKRMRRHANVSFLSLLQSFDEEMICRNIRRDIVTDFILEKGKNAQIVEFVKEYKHE